MSTLWDKPGYPRPYMYVLSQAQLDAIMVEVRARAVRILRAGERSDPINDYADKAYIRQALAALGDAPKWAPSDSCFSLDPTERTTCGWCGGQQHDPGDCALARQAEAQRLCDADRLYDETETGR